MGRHGSMADVRSGAFTFAAAFFTGTFAAAFAMIPSFLQHRRFILAPAGWT
jgi:hypothetical protein